MGIDNEICVARAEALDSLGHVIGAACWAITQAMINGAEHGYVDEWKEQSWVEHMSHACIHVQNAYYGTDSEDDAETHITHAICRLAMALIRKEDERAGKV